MTNTYLESVYFHYILETPIFLNTAKPEFFSNSNVKELFEIAKDHALKYKEPPTKDQMTQLVHMKGLGEKYNDDIITGIYNLREKLDEYDKEWLESTVGSWIQLKNLDVVLRKTIAFVKTTNITTENTLEIVEKVRHMMSSETAIDFTFDLGSDFWDAKSHLQTRLARTPSGYEYIDLCTKGGYWKGSLIVLVGGAKSGKSLWCCNMAAKSVLEGYNTAYITLELQEEIVNSRIGANLLNISLEDYENVAKDQDLLKNKLHSVKQKSLKPVGNLHIKEFPASTASSNDIANYLRKAQELLGYKFDNVFIDYLNIMKNWRNPNTENMYMKIKQICEDVRAMGQQNQWAIISVTQSKRDAINSSDVIIQDIAESIGLLHTADVLFAIITTPENKAKGEYFLKCLANRVTGFENTKKRYTIDWKYMRIEEDRMSPVEDMNFFIGPSLSVEKQQRSQRRTIADIDTMISNRMTPADPTPDNIPIKETKNKDILNLNKNNDLFKK